MEIFYYIGVFIFISGLYDLFTPDAEEPDMSAILSNSGFIGWIKNEWLSLIQGMLSIGWKIAGIIISEQRGLFIVDLSLLVTFPFIYFAIKDKKQQDRFCDVDTILSLIIIAIILFNHFYFGKN